MLPAFITRIVVSPAFAAAARRVCVPGLPTSVTVTTSYFSTSFATAG